MPERTLARISEELIRWKEALGLSIVAVLGWFWRMGRKEQQREHRIKKLEDWRDEHCNFSESNTHRIDGIAQHLCQQDIKLAQISQQNISMQSNIIDMRRDIRAMNITRQPCGKRWYDQPPEPSKFCTEEDEDEEEDAAHAS